MGNFSFWDGAAGCSHSRVGVQGFPGLIVLTGCDYKYISSHPAGHIFYGTAMYRSHIKIKRRVYSNAVGQTVLWLLIVLWWLNFQRTSSNCLSLFLWLWGNTLTEATSGRTGLFWLTVQGCSPLWRSHSRWWRQGHKTPQEPETMDAGVQLALFFLFNPGPNQRKQCQSEGEPTSLN